jgi:hypothetical protein
MSACPDCLFSPSSSCRPPVIDQAEITARRQVQN